LFFSLPLTEGYTSTTSWRDCTRGGWCKQ